MGRLENIIDKLDNENHRKSTLIEDLKSEHQIQVELIESQYMTQKSKMQDDLKRKSQKISQMLINLRKTQSRLEENDNIKRMYIDRSKQAEKRVKDLEKEMSKSLGDKNRLGKENRELRGNLGFREKTFLKQVKEMKEKLRSSENYLLIEKENNATLVNTLNQNQISKTHLLGIEVGHNG